MKLSQLNRLNELDVNGTVVRYHGIDLLIAPLGNERYDKALQRLVAQYRAANSYPTGNLPDDVMNDLARQAVAEGVLVGWEQLTDDNDQPIPYTPQKSRELIMTNYRFFRDVMIFATNMRTEALRLAAADEGNSNATSSGS